MTVRTKKDFYIFEGKTFKNWGLLNDAGLMLLSCIREILADPAKAAKWYNNIDSIIVTSQDRDKRNSNHNNGQAIDLTVYPAGMSLWLFKELREYRYTIYISSYNRHIHFDLRTQGLSGVEVLRAPGAVLDTYPKSGNIMDADGYNIRIEAPERLQNYLYKWYEAYNLKDLKLEIWQALNSPFIGTKKLIQYSQDTAEEFFKNTMTALSWLPWVIGGLAAFIILKDKKNYIVVRGK